MGVTPAENLPASTTAYRELVIIDTPAIPISIEFVRLPHGFASLNVRSPSPSFSDPFFTLVNDGRWNEIEQRWLMYRRRQLGEDAAASQREATSKVKGGIETVCIPQGSIDLEILHTGKIWRQSADGCSPEQTAFADFLLDHAIKIAGSCALNAPVSYGRTKKLLRCLGPAQNR
jgi:hypothetical protein